MSEVLRLVSPGLAVQSAASDTNPDTEESEGARRTAGTDPGEVADSEDVKSSNEESGNKNEIDTMVAEAIAEKKKTNNGNSTR